MDNELVARSNLVKSMFCFGRVRDYHGLLWGFIPSAEVMSPVVGQPIVPKHLYQFLSRSLEQLWVVVQEGVYSNCERSPPGMPLQIYGAPCVCCASIKCTLFNCLVHVSAAELLNWLQLSYQNLTWPQMTLEISWKQVVAISTEKHASYQQLDIVSTEQCCFWSCSVFEMSLTLCHRRKSIVWWSNWKMCPCSSNMVFHLY